MQLFFDNSGGAMQFFLKIAWQSNENIFRKTPAEQCIFFKKYSSGAMKLFFYEDPSGAGQFF